MLVKPLVRPIVRAIAGNPTASLGSGFSPTSLFADGSKGVVYDNNDLSSFYLDSNGATAATVNGLVGLQLDQSAGLALGTELVTNGDFSSSAGWTVNAGWTIAGGKASFSSGSAANINRLLSTTAGKWYRIEFEVLDYVAGSVYAQLNNPGSSVTPTYTSNGVKVSYVLATANFLQVSVIAAAGSNLSVDNISVRELPGNHRYQTTTGSKPVLRGTPTGANLVTNGDFASGTGWTTGAGWAIGSGVATATTSSGALTSTLAATASKNYRVTYTITRSAGSVQVSFGGRTGASRSAAGTYVDYLDSTTNTNALVFTGTTFSGTVDNVEVVDVSAGSVTAPYGLQYDGVDDFLQTAAVDFTATDKMFVCAGVRKLSDSADGTVVELSVGVSIPTNGSFNINAPGSSAVTKFQFSTRGTGTSTPFTASATYNAPYLGVVTGISEIATDTALLRVNGTQVDTRATDQGTGNYGNHAIYFGRRAGTSLPYNGLDFGYVICGKTLTSNQISSTERYIAQRTGISL